MANAPEITFDNADVQNQRKKMKSLKEGYMKMRVVGAEASVSKNSGSYTVRLSWSPVTPDGQLLRQFRATSFLTVPVRNKDKEGHAAPATAGIWYQYFLATGVELPRYPRRNEGDEKSWTLANGKSTSDPDEAEKARQEINTLVIRKAVDRYNDAATFKDDEAICLIKRNGVYANVDRVFRTLPEDAELISDDFGSDGVDEKKISADL
jgi:hypothetical protein